MGKHKMNNKTTFSRLLCTVMIMAMVVCMVGCGGSKNDASNGANAGGAIDSNTVNGNQVNSYVLGNVTEGVLAKVDFTVSNIGKVTLNFKHDFSVESYEAKDKNDIVPYMYDTMFREQAFSDLYANYIELIGGDGPTAFKNPGAYKRAIAPWIMPLVNAGLADLSATKLTIDIAITDGAKFDEQFLAENPDPVAGISDVIIGFWKDIAEISGLANIPNVGPYIAVVNGEERALLGDASIVASNNSDAGNSSYNTTNNNSASGNASSAVGNKKFDISSTPGAVRAKLKLACLDGGEVSEIVCEILESNCSDIKAGETILVYDNISCGDSNCTNYQDVNKIMWLDEGDVVCFVPEKHKCKLKSETVFNTWLETEGVTNTNYWACNKLLAIEAENSVCIKITDTRGSGDISTIKGEVLESMCAEIKVGDTILLYENLSRSEDSCYGKDCGSRLYEMWYCQEGDECRVVVAKHKCAEAYKTVDPMYNVTNSTCWAVSRYLGYR